MGDRASEAHGELGAASASTSTGDSSVVPRDAKKVEIIAFVKQMLDDRKKRCTYISVKRGCLEVFTEKSFSRAKSDIQTMLETYHKRLTPARPRGRDTTVPPGKNSRSMATGKRTNDSTRASEGSESQAHPNNPKRKQAKKASNPKLYFYQMSNEEDSGAEGNRFISNSDL